MSLRDRMENDPVLVEFGPPSDKLELTFDDPDDFDDFDIQQFVPLGDTLEP